MRIYKYNFDTEVHETHQEILSESAHGDTTRCLLRDLIRDYAYCSKGDVIRDIGYGELVICLLVNATILVNSFKYYGILL